jgi:uncharacterized protein YjiS (DUF1127 family)
MIEYYILLLGGWQTLPFLRLKGKQMFYNYFNYIVENLLKIVRFNRAMSELNNLSDRELADMGINRYEIYHIVHKSMMKENE